MPCPVPELASYLRGDWLIIRRVNKAAEGSGDASGTARFTPAAAGLDYHETVRVRLGRFQGEASRRYCYRFSKPAVAEVRFDDGSSFHTLDLRTGRCRVEHRCGRDLYRGIIRVLGPSIWSVRWRIRGPRKDACIFTLYRRPADHRDMRLKASLNPSNDTFRSTV